jgi:hypothetical protein
MSERASLALNGPKLSAGAHRRREAPLPKSPEPLHHSFDPKITAQLTFGLTAKASWSAFPSPRTCCDIEIT